MKGAKPDMTVEKQSRILEEPERSDKHFSMFSCFGTLLEGGCDLLVFFFLAHPASFCSLVLALGGSHLSSLIVKTPAFQWPSCTLAEL